MSKSNMEQKNSCYTYFAISGTFDPNHITEIIELVPTRQWSIGDLRRNNTPYEFALWEYGRCDEYDVFTERQMIRTIEPLVSKMSVLQEIKRTYDVGFCLNVVPSIYTDEPTPCLAPNREVIEFCYLTDTAISIDLYVFDSEGEQ